MELHNYTVYTQWRFSENFPNHNFTRASEKTAACNTVIELLLHILGLATSTQVLTFAVHARTCGEHVFPVSLTGVSPEMPENVDRRQTPPSGEVCGHISHVISPGRLRGGDNVGDVGGRWWRFFIAHKQSIQ